VESSSVVANDRDNDHKLHKTRFSLEARSNSPASTVRLHHKQVKGMWSNEFERHGFEKAAW
jgi:hypothetical protein